jgi:hypothetical protein
MTSWAIDLYQAPAWHGACLSTGTPLPVLHMFVIEFISNITGYRLG